MEVSQMNKTAILSFIIDEVVLKCRNVSSNMRKRIHWMLTLKEIIVKKYDERALILNGWVRIRKGSVGISNVEEMKKGVSNYYLKTQEQVDRMISLNNEVRCYSLRFKIIDPIDVESIRLVLIDKNNYKMCSKCSFNKAKNLYLYDLSTDQIKFILTRCKRIDELEISDCSLNQIDFSLFRIKQFQLRNISFKGSVCLPREIDKLHLCNCESSNLIKAQKVKEIIINDSINNPKQSEELLKTLKGVQVARIDEPLTECITSLPSIIRTIENYEFWKEADNLEEIVKRFPYLIHTNGLFPIEAANKTNLKIIKPMMIQTEQKFSLRPKKIMVVKKNAVQLNNHPELFEKVEYVDINTDKFNYDVLPSEIKRIRIENGVKQESFTLNRLKKERG